MPREKWLVDPGELDEFQREIRDLSIDDSYLVKGCAGSGKTILALYRANDILIRAKAENTSPSFTMVVFTKSLKSFIRSGIKELGIGPRQVIHYSQWDGNPVDYIVVDEAQDFTKDEIDVLFAAMGKSIMFYGDTQQQVYQNRLAAEEIAAHLKLPQKELFKNYRLPKLVASFASYLSNDTNLENKCVRPGGQKPKLKRFESWESELDYIMAEIQTRNYTDVAILLPFNNRMTAPIRNFHRNVESVRDYFQSKEFQHEFKLSINEGSSDDLDFDSDLPKIIPFHSSKGLQFETVFIPFCDFPLHGPWFIKHYKNPLYVALTRSYRNLYLTYTNQLTPFFKDIPSSKYE